MKLYKTSGCSKTDLLEKKFDVVIVSSGYEARAINISSQINLNSIPLKYAIAFKNAKTEESRCSNDIFFEQNGFTIIEEGESQSTIVSWIMDEIFESNSSNRNLNILIDYSSMTRVWYARFIEIIRDLDSLTYCINMFFSYSPSDFIEAPSDPGINTNVGPIEGFSGLSIPSSPTAIIIGLGYESIRAFGLNEYLDAEPFVFYSDSSFNSDFSREVEKNNSDLLGKINDDHIFKFPLHNTKYTEAMLSQLCEDLSGYYRVILAPCGPKPFTLLCLLISCRIPNIDVWRISAGASATIKNKTCSSKDIITHFAEFVNFDYSN
jgi:hypothetical protein